MPTRRNLAQAYSPEQYAELAKMYAAPAPDAGLSDRDLAEMFGRDTGPVYSIGQGIAEAGSKIGEAYLRKKAREKQQTEKAADYKAEAQALQSAMSPMSIADANEGRGLAPAVTDAAQMQAQSDAPDDMKMAAIMNGVPDRLKMQVLPAVQAQMQAMKPKTFTGELAPGHAAYIDGQQVAAAPPETKTPTPHNVTTGAGVFAQNPDGSLGARLGDAPKGASDNAETWSPLSPEDMQKLGYPAGTVGKKSSRGNIDVTYQPKADKAMSPIETKELFEADDAVNAGNAAKTSLQRALALNETAASGSGAWFEQAYNKVADKQAAADTSQFKAEVLDQALQSLRATFGGNPTEGERGILLEIQAAPTMTREERKRLLDRAITMIDTRVARASTRKTQIQEGDFGRNAAAKVPNAPIDYSKMSDDEIKAALAARKGL